MFISRILIHFLEKIFLKEEGILIVLAVVVLFLAVTLENKHIVMEEVEDMPIEVLDMDFMVLKILAMHIIVMGAIKCIHTEDKVNNPLVVQ